MRPESSLSDRAWMAVSRIWDRWNDWMVHKEGFIMRPLRRLTERAAAVRARHLRGSDLPPAIQSDPTQTQVSDSLMEDQMEDLSGNLLAVDAASLDIFRNVVTNLGL